MDVAIDEDGTMLAVFPIHYRVMEEDDFLTSFLGFGIGRNVLEDPGLSIVRQGFFVIMIPDHQYFASRKGGEDTHRTFVIPFCNISEDIDGVIFFHGIPPIVHNGLILLIESAKGAMAKSEDPFAANMKVGDEEELSHQPFLLRLRSSAFLPLVKPSRISR